MSRMKLIEFINKACIFNPGKYFILNGHPDKECLCFTLAKNYHEIAISSGANYQLIHLIQLHFNLILVYGYRKRTDIEQDL